MRLNKEITALLRLIDDPDDEVFGTVADKIVHYGKSIIPNLEQLWEVTADESVQERIELLIHRVHFENLQAELLEWSQAQYPELLQGAIIVAKYQFPELNPSAIFNQFDLIRRNVWLELNNYQTAMEKVNIINSIFYNYYKFQGHELTERESRHFFINQVLDNKQGNAYSLGVLYLTLCQMLDIPIYAMDIPRQFVMAYIDILHPFLSTEESGVEQIQFFVDPLNGMIYTQNDVDVYLKKINAKDRESYFTPLFNKRIIYKMLEELALCYSYKREDAKAEEIQQLIGILGDV